MVKRKQIVLSILCLFTLVFLCMSMGQRTLANSKEETSHTKYHSVCVDEANLLNEEQKTKLLKMADTIGKKTKWNIVIATIENANGKTTQTLGEELFEANTLGDNGITCIIDMDHRQIYMNTMGTAISYLTDKRIAAITKDSFSYATDKNYSQCFDSMLTGAKAAYEKGIPDNLVIYNTSTGKKEIIHKLMPSEIVGAIIAAFIGGFVFFLIVFAKYKMKLVESNFDSKEDIHLQLNQKEDQFLYQDIMHRHIQQNNSASSGGGKSTTHNGSGGKSSGGGGHSF